MDGGRRALQGCIHGRLLSGGIARKDRATESGNPAARERLQTEMARFMAVMYDRRR